MKDLLSLKEFAEYFSITIMTVRNWKKKGLVKFIKISGKNFIESKVINKLKGDK